ncbi:MAG: isoprenyl transferase [Actinobacteria bacterium HGW-Actinobacteria-1]|nr:MAG: isoprenyl transferase [Actinobacteria bacterium HGW-Actinobacteria-1]
MPSDRSHLEKFFSSKRDRDLIGLLRADDVPRHVAIIMDGNGRWAAKRGLPRAAGHRAGVKAVREVLAAAIELGIEYLTVYSFSSENWSRPVDEVNTLMGLFVEVLERELDSLQRLGIRVRVIGRDDTVPSETMNAFRRTEAKTAENTALTFVVALNYGGRAELSDAVRAVVSDVVQGKLEATAIDETTISQHLYTRGMPDPDLVIRTSGEMRISNFLLWQIAYSELWVTAVLWPDFSRHDLLRAVIDYQRRERRFGGTS